MLAENLQKFIVSLVYSGLVFLSFILLINPMNVNRKANIFFGLFLFFWSGYWIVNVLMICQLPVNGSFVNWVNCLRIFTPVFLYFSVVFFANPNYRFHKYNLFCFIVPVIYIGLLLQFNGQNPFYSTMMFVDILHNLPYIAIVYFTIRNHQEKIQTISSSTESINLQWLIRVLFLLFITIVVTIGYELYNAFINKIHQHLTMDLLFLFIVYVTAYYSLRQKEIYPVDLNQRKALLAVESQKESPHEKKKLIPEDEFGDLKQKLIRLMDQQKPYLDGELNLLKLAGLMEISVHQLSYLINKGFDENFFQFVNKYRVEYAKGLLLDMKESKFSLLGIAFEAGFNSKTSFNTIFKKITNLTPSQFQKEHDGLQN